MPSMKVGVGVDVLAIWLHYTHSMRAICPTSLRDREVGHDGQTDTLKLEYLFDN